LPVNGEGGQVYGFEFAYTQSFDFLPAPFDGFGVVINYAYADSDLSFVNGLSGRTIDIGLPGLSKHVSNPTLFYEKAGFSTRLGLRYRSGFVAPQIGLNEQITGIDEELVADAQVSYEFQPGSLAEGVTLLFQANNLTDEPTQSFFGTEAQTGTIQYFGRQFFLGASYTF
jgi:TonB-dependent receptor